VLEQDDIDLNSDGLQIPGLYPDADDEIVLCDWVDATSAELAAAPQVGIRAEAVETPAPKPKRKSKAKRSFTPSTDIGRDDAEFLVVWEAHRKRHEKHDANGIAAEDGSFGIAGVGSRAAAWKQWALLSPEDRSAAANTIERTLAYRLSQGWKLQQVSWFIKDKPWTRVPQHFSSPQSCSSHSSPPSTPTPATDLDVEALRFWIRTGKSIALPGGRCPSDWAGWRDADRARFKVAVDNWSRDNLSLLGDLRARAPAAWAYCTGLPEPAVVTVDMRRLGVVSAVRQAAASTKIPFERKPRRATFSQADLHAYLQDVM
jgi:hypothetical protein